MAPLIRSLAAVASLALWLGPSRFRVEYGEVLAADFAALLHAEQRRRGPAAMLVLWMRGVGDAVKAARRERRMATPSRGAGRPFGDLSGDRRGAARAARRAPGLSIAIVLTSLPAILCSPRDRFPSIRTGIKKSPSVLERSRAKGGIFP